MIEGIAPSNTLLVYYLDRSHPDVLIGARPGRRAARGPDPGDVRRRPSRRWRALRARARGGARAAGAHRAHGLSRAAACRSSTCCARAWARRRRWPSSSGAGTSPRRRRWPSATTGTTTRCWRRPGSASSWATPTRRCCASGSRVLPDQRRGRRGGRDRARDPRRRIADAHADDDGTRRERMATYPRACGARPSGVPVTWPALSTQKRKGGDRSPPKTRRPAASTSSSWEPPSWPPSWSSPLNPPSQYMKGKAGGVNGPPPLSPGALTSSSWSRPSWLPSSSPPY